MLVKVKDDGGSTVDTTPKGRSKQVWTSPKNDYVYPPIEPQVVAEQPQYCDDDEDEVDDEEEDINNHTMMKPFFIMDWLDQIEEKDLERAQKMLQESRHWKVKTSSISSPGCSSSEKRSSSPAPRSPTSATTTTTTATTPFAFFRERSIKVGNSWNAKGLRQAKVGAWSEALRCWENALEIRTQVLGETHLDVANTWNNIGIAQGKLDLIPDAIESLQRALAIRIEHLGREHEEVATTLHNIGNIFQQGNDLEAAVKCFCESKQLHEKLLGPNHVQVARACVAMGHTYYQAGEYKDAREAYLDALIIFERSGLSKGDIEVQNTLGDVQEIDRLLKKAVF